MPTLPSDPLAAVRLLDLLARFEAVATLYPASHARVLEIGGALRAQVSAVAGAAGHARVECAGESVRVQGVEVDANEPAARRLSADFATLSVLSIEIAAQAALEELHGFARQWRVAVQRAARAQGLHVAELGEIPPSVRVQHREFGRRVGGAGDGAWATSSAPSAFEVAAAVPGDGARHVGADPARAARLAHRAMQRVAERVESLDPKASPSAADPESRALDEVLSLAGDALEHAIERFLSDAADDGGIRRLFESIELATALSRDSESARLLVDVIQRAAADVSAEQELIEEQGLLEPAAGAGERYERTLDELRGDIAAFRESGEMLDGLEREDRRECLSILLATLAGKCDPAAAAAVIARFRALLLTPLEPAERELLADSLAELCARLDAAAIDVFLPALASALGGAYAGTIDAAICAAARAGDDDRLEILWPHLANEALLGSRTCSTSSYAAILEQVQRLPRARLPSAMRRLLRLEAAGEGKIERHAFRPPRPELGPLYAALLESPAGARVAALLLAAIRERPSGHPAAELIATFEECHGECRALLARMFAAEDARAARDVELRAGRAIARRLELLPAESGGEPWVRAAIEALGKHGIEGAEPALRRIANERRWLVFPRWPASCRAAAARALGALARRETGGGVGR